MISKKIIRFVLLAILTATSNTTAIANDYIESLLADAQYALEQGYLNTSSDLVAEVLIRDQNRFEAYLILSQLYFIKEDYEKSLDAIHKSIEVADDTQKQRLKKVKTSIIAAQLASDTQTMVNKAMDAMDKNHFYEAGSILQKAWYAQKNEWDIAEMAIDAWLVSESHSSILELIAEAKRHSPPNDLKARLESLERELQTLNESEYQSLIDAAQTLYEKKESTKALEALGEAIQRFPNYSEAYLMAAGIHTSQNNQDEALNLLEKAKNASGFNKSTLMSFDDLAPLLTSEEAIALVTPVIGARGANELSKQRITLPERHIKSPPKQILNSIGLSFKYIPPGQFLMGSPEKEPGRDWDSEQQHTVKISKGYYLSTTEVTQAQWSTLMKENPSRHMGDSLPVHRVSQLQAKSFLRKLSDRDGVIYRLPTEAEWEYACRAGSQETYSGHSNKALLERDAWSSASRSTTKPFPVATKSPNAFGLFDMHGNAYELVADYHSPFINHHETDPSGPQTGNYIVIKGGSWSSYASGLRCAHRAKILKGDFEIDTGFRVLRELE